MSQFEKPKNKFRPEKIYSSNQVMGDGFSGRCGKE